MMKVRGFRRQASIVAACAAALLPAACGINTEPVIPLFWIGVFQPDAGAPYYVGGTSEMVANPNNTAVGIFLEAAPGDERTLSWHVRNGTCDGEGTRVAGLAAFPPVTVSASGLGTAIGDIRRRLPLGNYAAEVFTGADGSGQRLACANLTED